MSEGARAGGKGSGSVKRRREDGGKGVRLLHPGELPAAMMQESTRNLRRDILVCTRVAVPSLWLKTRGKSDANFRAQACEASFATPS